MEASTPVVETVSFARDRFHLITAVWGDHHVSLFVELGLPSLISTGNLPALAAAATVSYQILTTETARASIESSGAFARLCDLVEIEFSAIDPVEGAGDPHLHMSDAHRIGIARARALGAGAVIVPPDCVFADGSLAALGRIVAGGADIVYMTGVRLDSETAGAALTALRPDEAELAVAPRALVRLALSHLHRIAEASFFDPPGRRLMPANLFWRVGAAGLLARCYHLHPIYVRPTATSELFTTTVDDDLALASYPDGGAREYVVRDSDELAAFELSRPAHDVETGYAAGEVADIAAWAEIGANRSHRALVQHAIRLHGGEIDAAEWAPVEAAATRVVAGADRLLGASAARLLLFHPRNFWHRSLTVLRRRPVRSGSDRANRVAHAARLARWAVAGAPYLAAQLAVSSLWRLAALLDAMFGSPPNVRPWHWRWHFEAGVLRPLIETIDRAENPVLFVDAPDRPLGKTLAAALARTRVAASVASSPEEATQVGGAYATIVFLDTPEMTRQADTLAALGGRQVRVAARWPLGTRLSAALAERTARSRLARYLAARLVVRALPLRLGLAPAWIVLSPLASLSIGLLNSISLQGSGHETVSREGTHGQPAG